ncbi:probable global transcription activator snf2l1 isoform 2 [Stylonychia lemnae]|uniref:Probable global transcription activator snf2l1 isoform 2 n=1 Tax=Stylonychia lemnae TaxID=5949 RepID=A0A078B339_STYLE|nr:probable global transcription activator snf2l1 isoform 2 [Stylonychia lemnae]|eukprot:CDW88930.1 probable global transcription activator snf2l1 isoform 2 [Stylonychia lemnae]
MKANQNSANQKPENSAESPNHQITSKTSSKKREDGTEDVNSKFQQLKDSDKVNGKIPEENEDDYDAELDQSTERNEKIQSQVSVEEVKEIMNKNKSKLEKLLCQSDIFECLRKINNGEIKSYDELDFLATKQQQIQQENLSRRRLANNKVDEIEDIVGDKDNKLFEIQKIEKQPDNLIGGILRDYQIEGLNWLYKLEQANLNGILADEMGLGKTIQSIAIIALIESFKTKEQIESRTSHHVIIVPKIVLGKWKKEITDWLPTIRLFQFYGSNEERVQQVQEMRQHKFDVMLTTFETVIREKGELSRYNFDFLILDEAQRIKNDESVLSQVLRRFKTKHRILLTGTPLQNNLRELWALLNFLMPKLFDSAEEFKELFMIKSEDSGAQEQIIKQIHRLLRPFMLRRLKSDVEKNLPTKKEIYLFIGLSKLQKQLYKNILTGNIDVVNGVGDKIKLLNVLMQLKKVCNHPYLFDKVEPGPPFIDGEHLIDNSMKFKVLDLLIPKLLNQGCKILIFSQMTRLLDILDDFLRFRGFQYCRIDGQTSANDREIRIEDFQKPDSTKQLFILSTRAGGLGINLHSANVVIIFDSDWNPQVDLQAIDRAHRIGQKRDVVVYRFVTEGSVEEKIVERAARKLRVDHLIMQKGKFGGGNDNNPNKMNAQEMLQMIKYGAQEIILTEQDGQLMDENIDSIIEHSMKRTDEINKELSKLEEKFNLNNVSLTGEDEKQTDLYTFEGQDYKKKQVPQAQEIDFIDIGQRERKQLSYDIDKYYREALNQPTQTKEKKKLKGWKAQANGGYDHQFFDSDKLNALEEKENNWNSYKNNPEEYIKNSETKQKPPQYSNKDQYQKENLIKQGFPNWSKKDFFTFIRMCETFGRDNYAKIAEAFPNKTIEEIKDYSKAFWQKWEDHIENGHKYVERIEKGEAEIEKYKQIESAIEEKFQYNFQEYVENNPEKQFNQFMLDDLTIMRKDVIGQRPQQSLSNFDFSEEEDKFIAMALFKYGYGSWDLIRNELRNSDRFRFNWIVKTRTVIDIQKRCEYLVQKFKKEVQIIKKIEEEKRTQKEEEERRIRKLNEKKMPQKGKKQDIRQTLASSNSKLKQKTNGKSHLSRRNDCKRGRDKDSDEKSDEESDNNGSRDFDESEEDQSESMSDVSEFKMAKSKGAKVSKTLKKEEIKQKPNKNGVNNQGSQQSNRRQAKEQAKLQISESKNSKVGVASSNSNNQNQSLRRSTRRS